MASEFILFADGTKISRTLISAMYVRLTEAETPLSYKMLLTETPLNVWIIPLLAEDDKSILDKIIMDDDPGAELEALRRIKLDQGLS